MSTTIHLGQSNTASLPPPPGAIPLLSELVPLLAPKSIPTVSPRPVPPPTFNGVARTQPITPLPAWRAPKNPGLVLGKALRGQWRIYCKQLRQCQDEFSETSVHQLRVATRRLMTRFDLVGCLISNQKAERARRKLKRRLKFLGELRDLQVQISAVKGNIEVYPELAGFLETMEAREHQLAGAVMDRVARMKTGKLKKWAGACCKDLASTPAGPDGQLLATRALHFLGAAFDTVKMRRQLIDSANSETLHSTRVAFKKFRYIVEALSPEFTGLGKLRLRRFATYQRRLGNLQDLEVLQGCIAQFLNCNPEAAVALQRFSRHVATRRRHALRSCLDHVDDLFQFYFVPDFEAPQPARNAA